MRWSGRFLMMAALTALAIAALAGWSEAALAQAEEAAQESEPAEKAWPPRNDGLVIPILFGPEGIGGGLGYYFHDLGGKQGRDLLLHDVFTNTAYKQLLGDFTEPDFLLPGGTLNLRGYYLHRTGLHFFGIGNDTDIEDGAYYGAEIYSGRLSYEWTIARGLGLGGGAEYHRTALHDGKLGDPNFDPNYPELDRPLSEVYPALVRSDDFHFREMTHNWFATVFHDDRDHPVFPTRGGYQRATITRVDESLGADWNYWLYTAEAAVFVPAPNDHNVAGLYARWDRLDGRELPFWELPALGHGRLNLADYTDDFGLRGYWENRFQDKNRALASFEFRHRTRAEWWPEDFLNFPKPKEKEPRFKFMAGQKTLGETAHEFVLNSSTLVFLDAGNTWGDHESLDAVRLTPGVGAVLYFDTGMAMRVTVGFSDELTFYQVFADWQAF